jgi:hypothetical protein
MCPGLPWEGRLCDSLEGFKWLYRGVPVEAVDEIEDVEYYGEVRPARPDRVGEEWRQRHSTGMTRTGYTSWTTDRSFAEEAARAHSEEDESLSGLIRVLRVRVSTLDLERRVFEGRADEDEYLIEGTVENVEFSEDEADEEDDD